MDVSTFDLPPADKAAWLRSAAPGAAFAEVGVLSDAGNLLSHLAAEAGAVHATLVDTPSTDDPRWNSVDARVRRSGLNSVTLLSADIGRDGFAQRVGRHDIVHCAGVLYHHPDPFRVIQRLRGVTRDHLLLTTMCAPPVMKNEAGLIDLRGGRGLFIHGMNDEKRREVVARHFSDLGIDVPGLTVPMDAPLVQESGEANTGIWWWVLTAELVASMLRSAGFTVVASGEEWPGRSVSFHCRVRGD